MPFFFGFLGIVLVVGMISTWATLFKSRDLVPRSKFGPFVSGRRHNIAIAAAVLFGPSVLAMMGAVWLLLSTPPGGFNGSRLLPLGISLASSVVFGAVMLVALDRAQAAKALRYTMRGNRKRH
ncbi:MAG: hypothetical protein ABSB09_16245 [Acidimicrobiales bacterium]